MQVKVLLGEVLCAFPGLVGMTVNQPVCKFLGRAVLGKSFLSTELLDGWKAKGFCEPLQNFAHGFNCFFLKLFFLNRTHPTQTPDHKIYIQISQILTSDSQNMFNELKTG